MNYKNKLSLVFCIGILSSCTPQKPIPNLSSTEKKMNYEIKINEGETKIIQEPNCSIYFSKIIEDSRCPLDVECVWKGIAIVSLEIKDHKTGTKTILLSTEDDEKKMVKKSFFFNGYTFTLEKLFPFYKNSKKKEKYNVIVKISKEEKNTSTM